METYNMTQIIYIRKNKYLHEERPQNEVLQPWNETEELENVIFRGLKLLII